MARPFYVYILACSDNSYYAGHTDDLHKRCAQHQTGATGGYTSSRLPVRLVWSQEFSTRIEAKETESAIKSWSRAKKEVLIKGDFVALSTLAKKSDWQGYRERSTRRSHARRSPRNPT